MTKKELTQYSELLKASRDALLAAARRSLELDTTIDTNELADEVDLASAESTQSLSLRLRDRERFVLRKIDEALARIDAGTYGLCDRCEEPIGAKRLQARPITTLCIRCKEEQERRESSYV